MLGDAVEDGTDDGLAGALTLVDAADASGPLSSWEMMPIAPTTPITSARPIKPIPAVRNVGDGLPEDGVLIG